MIDIPLKAEVLCTDGHAGTTTAIIIDPVKRNVTHVVVESIKYLDYLVPLDRVTDTTPNSVHLDCTIAELHEMRSFTEAQYMQSDLDDGTVYAGAYMAPYVTMVPDYGGLIEEEKVPFGELAVHRGAQVHANDGHIGVLEEFVVEPDTGHVTHIVLQKGHLLGKRDVVIPVSAIDHGDYDALYLNVSKKDVRDLPGVSVQRHYKGQE
jgi:hypothetical protein